MTTMNTLICKIFIVFLCLFEHGAGKKICDADHKFLCRKQTECSSCIRAHACCNWCYDPTFKGAKCDLADSLTRECNVFYIEFNKNETQMQNFNAEDSNDDSDAQITPRKINVFLRKGKNLQRLTTNYKLAFGSFLDKPGMPFTQTDEQHLKNPCRWDGAECNPSYLFKHILNFTHSSDRFFKAVNKSKISANADDPDGALEAIFHILVCGEKFGWTQESRKLVILSTDSFLHVAGDGILVGATLRNNGTCLINYNGEHTAPLQYDYPSIDEIRYWLREKKVNLIVAAPREKSGYYLNLANSILEKEMYVGELERDSSNILDLVSDGFKRFIRQVEFSANTSDIPNLSVRFFADCNGIGIFEELNECKNINEYDPINFKAELNLTEWEDSDSETLIIREKNINEEIFVRIETVGRCKCTNLKNIKTCIHGINDCDQCKCDGGWKGEYCEEECTGNTIGCIANTSDYYCSGRGECQCGKCECERTYSGEFCQYKCPVDDNGKICAGHGTCTDGNCVCFSDYSGHNCNCSTSLESCKFGTDVLCNNKGTCSCNECQCDDNFFGAYCEKLKGENQVDENLLCKNFDSIVKDNQENIDDTSTSTADNITTYLKYVSQNYICSQECTIVSFEGNDRCKLRYCYEKTDFGGIQLLVTPKYCSKTAQAYGINLAIGLFTAIVGVGILFIFIKKWQISKLDQAEFKKFQASKASETIESNPLYKSPLTSYRNPLKR
ncbi:integrin beta-nu-like isoform X2 [Sitophilus oryzae]|uniref:Integrin beta n=1 Tax=Sitophilus oryzae TaxID=7048 RepID=A0A6J2XK05_SITOR|nr:integrin beta-nu-like isoform X2 [Sitophilus oryzae]